MRCVKADLPRELTKINIEIFSDMHLGSKKCDYKAIHDRIRKVQESNNTYAIILGDVTNNSTKTSAGDVYEEQLTPMQQIQQAVSLFEPIKDKIIGICSGNHERRSYKTDGIDLLYFMARELDRANYYDSAGCLLFIRFGKMSRGKKESNGSGEVRKMCYTLYMTHGSAGGRLVGGKANGLQRIGQVVNSDIVVVGHTHLPMTFRECTMSIDERNSSINTKEQVFVNASATLDYEEYAEIYGMKPSSKQSPIIMLDGTKKDIQVVI
jgi:predicted phosphodiesterase